MSFLNDLAGLFGGGTASAAVGSPYAHILERGRFFYPAGLHYGNPDTVVICDRCRKSGIKTCIGYESQDLCLPCVEQVASSIRADSGLTVPPPTPIIPRMVQPPMVQTLMMQDMLRRPIGNLAAMMEQGMYLRDRSREIVPGVPSASNTREPTTRMMHGMYDKPWGGR